MADVSNVVSASQEGPGEAGVVVNQLRKLFILAAAAASVSVVDTAVAHAYTTIDFGTNQAACETAEHQATAAGMRYADCFETGPGHYSLAYDN